jgi:hypothetical protein
MMEEISGNSKEILYDKNVQVLNLELCKDKIGTPIIKLQDWSGEDSKDLLTLHINEAIELKSMIDVLVLEWTTQQTSNKDE